MNMGKLKEGKSTGVYGDNLGQCFLQKEQDEDE